MASAGCTLRGLQVAAPSHPAALRPVLWPLLAVRDAAHQADHRQPTTPQPAAGCVALHGPPCRGAPHGWRCCTAHSTPAVVWRWCPATSCQSSIVSRGEDNAPGNCSRGRGFADKSRSRAGVTAVREADTTSVRHRVPAAAAHPQASTHGSDRVGCGRSRRWYTGTAARGAGVAPWQH